MEETIYRGLDGVNVDTSEICFIDGEKGELIYRGYDIDELTEATYEEVVYLLWEGELPTRAQLDAFRATIAANFAIPDEVVALMRGLPHDPSPMHALRTAVSALAAFDPDPDGVGIENVRRIGTALLAQVPVLVGTLQRVRTGQDPVAPRADLSIAANFLYTLNGEEPTEAATRVMDTALVLHAEHGSNASTFAARSTASTLTDVYSAITAGIASLKGPLHGGANTGVMKALEQIGSVENVENYVLETLAKPNGRIMGFGHRVYKVRDPRANILEQVARQLAEESGEAKWFEMSVEMERVMDREMAKKGREVKPNVDFFSASVYRMLGFPADMYTPLFAVSRISGWMAHLFEQYADNRLVRPRLVYEGPRGKTYTPLDQRG